MSDREERSGRLTAAARRAQLIEVGRSLFAKRGYDATSVEEIAERAKVSKPIVYEHFGGKEGLYAVVVDRETDYVVKRIAESVSSGSPRERVERAALAFLNYVKENPDGFAVLSRGVPVVSARGGMSSLLNDLAERVGDVFAATFKQAGYDPKVAIAYAAGPFRSATFVGQWWTESRKLPVEKVASHIAALAWMGLRHLPKRPRLLSDKHL